MEHTIEEYWQVVRGRVCVKCIDSDRQGNCLLTGDDECGLIMNFPKMVETVLSVKSEKLEPYIEALRRQVCALCKHQSPDGECKIRNRVDCGLDRYFPIIVEAIEGFSSEQPSATDTARGVSQSEQDPR